MITAQHFSTAIKGILTTIAVFLTAYMLVILLTYTANDPSWSHISSNMGQVSNMGGAVGAWLADLLYTFLGWSTWWLTVFIAFEAISLWWHRPQAFGALRVVGYVFVLLASCGVMTLLLQLFNVITTTDIRYGGILGVEVAYRLADFLTPVVAAVFLTVFLLLTLTFTFNIHWLHLFRVTLGLSGHNTALTEQDIDILQADIDADIDTNSDIDNYHSAEQQENEFQQKAFNDTEDNIADTDNDSNADSEHRTTGRNGCTTSPLFDQLALDLTDQQSEDDRTHSTSLPPHQEAPFGNLLDEFLVGSGIGESLLNLQRQEALEKRLNDGVIGLKDKVDRDSINEPRMSQEMTRPHNDTQLTQSPTLDNDNDIDANHDLNTDANHDSAKKMAGFSFGAAKTVASSLPVSESPVSESPVSKADTVLDIAAHTLLDSAQVNAEDKVQDNAEDKVENSAQHHTIVTDATYQLPQTKRAIDTPDTPTVDTPTVADNKATEDATLVSNIGNTPPSNPAKPFSELTQASTQPAPVQAPVQLDDSVNGSVSGTATPSTAHFAVPDSEAGNYIEEMVPDSNAEGVTELPDIHDDDAFMAKSRSMQTAKHRGNLSPLPEISILDKPDPDRQPSYTEADLMKLSELLEIKLQDFNVKAEVMNAIPGPVVTRFEVELAAGVKASKVTGISRDLARSLSMATLRVVEVIPGKPYIGIEIPNKKRAMVRLVELLETEKYKDPTAQISMAMGMDIGGKPIITDLARAPHMLVAGTTGSGKSVLVNAMLLSMLLKYKPSELRLILIDPKQLELANYNDIPHLLTPVVTDMNEAASSLSWCVAEMERRYQLMSLLKVRKLNEFNKKVIAAEKAGRPMIDPLWRPNDSVSIDRAPKLKTLPMIVIVADEFADMIMQVGKQAEELITRLAQKSRAAGIHLMLATQRPSVDVITGLIKANIPVRAALRVNSKIDSRTILDAGGAEDMLGNGDMLFLGPGQIEPERVHGAYVSDEEVNRVCDAWRERGAPDYIDNMASNFELSASGSSGAGNTSGEDDNLYDEAVAFVMETRKVSASSIQRKFSIGYNRAARIVDSMEEAGLVSAMGKSGKRELLM